MRASLFAAIAGTVLAAGLASAQVNLSGWVNVDNAFTASVSTVQANTGDVFMTGQNWQVTNTGSIALTEPGLYYLHIAAVDFGVPAMFIGTFTLDSPLASFENGTQTLNTDTVNWRVNTDGFGEAWSTPRGLGLNGSGWANFPLVSPNANFIWYAEDSEVAYFETTIRVIPAPAAACPLALLAFAFRRRSR